MAKQPDAVKQNVFDQLDKTIDREEKAVEIFTQAFQDAPSFLQNKKEDSANSKRETDKSILTTNENDVSKNEEFDIVTELINESSVAKNASDKNKSSVFSTNSRSGGTSFLKKSK